MPAKKNIRAYGHKRDRAPNFGAGAGKSLAHYKRESSTAVESESSELSPLDSESDDEDTDGDSDVTVDRRPMLINKKNTNKPKKTPKGQQALQKRQGGLPSSYSDSNSNASSSSDGTNSDGEDDEEDEDEEDEEEEDSDSFFEEKKTNSIPRKKKSATPLPVPKRLDLSRIRAQAKSNSPSPGPEQSIAVTSSSSSTDNEQSAAMRNTGDQKSRPRRESIVDHAYDENTVFPRTATNKNEDADDFGSSYDESLLAMLEQDDSSPGEEDVEAEEERAIVNELTQGEGYDAEEDEEEEDAEEAENEEDLFNASPLLAGEEAEDDAYATGYREDDEFDEDEEDDDDFYNLSDVSFHDDFFEPTTYTFIPRKREEEFKRAAEQEEDEYLWSCFFTTDEEDDSAEIFYSDSQGRLYSDTEFNNPDFSGEETDEDLSLPPPSHRKAGIRATEILSSSSMASRPPVLGSWDLRGAQRPFGIIDGLTTRNINGQQQHQLQSHNQLSNLQKQQQPQSHQPYQKDSKKQSRKRGFQSDSELSELALDEFINTDELAEDNVAGELDSNDPWVVKSDVPMSAFRNKGLHPPAVMYYGSGRRENSKRISSKEAIITPVRGVRRKMKQRLSKRKKQEEKPQQSPRINPSELIDELMDIGALSPLFSGIY